MLFFSQQFTLLIFSFLGKHSLLKCTLLVVTSSLHSPMAATRRRSRRTAGTAVPQIPISPEESLLCDETKANLPIETLPPHATLLPIMLHPRGVARHGQNPITDCAGPFHATQQSLGLMNSPGNPKWIIRTH